MILLFGRKPLHNLHPHALALSLERRRDASARCRTSAPLMLSLLLLCPVLLIGCATHQPIPPAYVGNEHTAKLVMQKVPPAPTMMDSGQGGLIGALVTATSRAKNMNQQLAGFDGNQVAGRFTDAFTPLMGEHLTMTNAPAELRLVVNIDTWGWFVPTTSFGIKVGDYECHLVGRVDVFDAQDKRIAFAHLRVAEPLGLKPEQDNARAAVGRVAQEFAVAAERALIHLPKGN